MFGFGGRPHGWEIRGSVLLKVRDARISEFSCSTQHYNVHVGSMSCQKYVRVWYCLILVEQTVEKWHHKALLTEPFGAAQMSS